MRVVKVPLRIPFFSGGTDIADFYKQDKGAALSVTIDKYVYVVIHRTHDERVHFSYSEASEKKNGTEEIEHVITREALKNFNIAGGITVYSVSDIKCRGTGLGASSAYTVGLVRALRPIHSTQTVAELAYYIEKGLCGFHIGKQDQYAAAYGGMNLYHFYPDDNVGIEHVSVPLGLEDNLFLIDTGIKRESSDILKYFKASLSIEDKFHQAQIQRDFAYEGQFCLNNNKVDNFGELLNDSWRQKKKLNTSTTNPRIDELYDYFIKEGALGGKLLGAGGGGYMLFYVPTQNHHHFCDALDRRHLEIVPFSFTSEGATIKYSDDC